MQLAWRNLVKHRYRPVGRQTLKSKWDGFSIFLCRSKYVCKSKVSVQPTYRNVISCPFHEKSKHRKLLAASRKFYLWSYLTLSSSQKDWLLSSNLNGLRYDKREPSFWNGKHLRFVERYYTCSIVWNGHGRQVIIPMWKNSP